MRWLATALDWPKLASAGIALQNMIVNGSYQIPAPPARVWQTLLDPEFLRLAIPGCEEMERESENLYRVRIKAGLGPIKSTFTGTVRLENLQPPQRYRMVTNTQGTAGFVNGTGDVELAASGSNTEVTYRGEVQVGGMLAAVGSRMVEAAFRKSVNDFFHTVAEHVASNE